MINQKEAQSEFAPNLKNRKGHSAIIWKLQIFSQKYASSLYTRTHKVYWKYQQNTWHILGWTKPYSQQHDNLLTFSYCTSMTTPTSTKQRRIFYPNLAYHAHCLYYKSITNEVNPAGNLTSLKCFFSIFLKHSPLIVLIILLHCDLDVFLSLRFSLTRLRAMCYHLLCHIYQPHELLWFTSIPYPRILLVCLLANWSVVPSMDWLTERPIESCISFISRIFLVAIIQFAWNVVAIAPLTAFCSIHIIQFVILCWHWRQNLESAVKSIHPVTLL